MTAPVESETVPEIRPRPWPKRLELARKRSVTTRRQPVRRRFGDKGCWLYRELEGLIKFAITIIS
jgi:hypothetical protein